MFLHSQANFQIIQESFSPFSGVSHSSFTRLHWFLRTLLIPIFHHALLWIMHWLYNFWNFLPTRFPVSYHEARSDFGWRSYSTFKSSSDSCPKGYFLKICLSITPRKRISRYRGNILGIYLEYAFLTFDLIFFLTPRSTVEILPAKVILALHLAGVAFIIWFK